MNEQEAKQLREEVAELRGIVDSLFNSADIPHNVEQAFKRRFQLHRLDDLLTLPENLQNAPLGSVTAPIGGATVDSQARTAIVDLTTRLEDLGLISPN